nr:leucine-rich repeat protein [Acinetobacter sp. NIPH 1852]
MHILNEDSEPHRFRLIPISGSAWSLSNGDPTFTEHEDGSLTFCLAAAEIIDEPWDIEYVLNGETIREVTGDPIPNYYFENQGEGRTSLVINNSITKININAFTNWLSATSLVIPESVINIGEGVFQNWISCISIRCLAVVPPVLGTIAFNNTNNAPIYVPAESVDAYKSASGWSYYASRIFAIPS